MMIDTVLCSHNAKYVLRAYEVFGSHLQPDQLIPYAGMGMFEVYNLANVTLFVLFGDFGCYDSDSDADTPLTKIVYVCDRGTPVQSLIEHIES